MRFIKKRISYILLILTLYPTTLFAQSYSSNNYNLTTPCIVTSGGFASSSNYSVENTSIGGSFGGISNSANYSLQAGLLSDKKPALKLSISVNPTTWPLNFLTVGASKITSNGERITILNDGDVKESFSLQVMDSKGTWSAADTVDGNGINRYIMSGIFTSPDVTGIDDSNFNELGNEDLILEGTPQTSTDTKYATTKSTKNGTNVLPNEERTLYLKFNAPKADTTQSQHDIWLIVGAELSE